MMAQRALAMMVVAGSIPLANAFCTNSLLPLQSKGLIGQKQTSEHLLLRPRRSSVPLATSMLVEATVGFVGKSVIIGGALAGGLHAVSGPDHFPALLPRCMGQKAWPAAKIGSIWGLGHAMSAMAMGLAVFLLKEKTVSSHSALGAIAFGADIAIGLSLCFIGVLSLVEARGRDFKKELNDQEPQKQTFAMKVNMMMNGIFHGLSLDGVPTLMPVLGAGSLATACTFLASYGVGCVLAMTMATIFIGQGTATLTKNTDFDLGKLIRGSAYGAIVIGIVWTARALLITT